MSNDRQLGIYAINFLGVRWSISKSLIFGCNTTHAGYGFFLMINPRALRIYLKVGHWIGINCNTLQVGLLPPQFEIRKKV